MFDLKRNRIVLLDSVNETNEIIRKRIYYTDSLPILRIGVAQLLILLFSLAALLNVCLCVVLLFAIGVYWLLLLLSFWNSLWICHRIQITIKHSKSVLIIFCGHKWLCYRSIRHNCPVCVYIRIQERTHTLHLVLVDLC